MTYLKHDPQYLIAPPPPPKWEWCFGGEWHSFTVRVQAAPNRFCRWMQRVCLGIHWRRIATSTNTTSDERIH